MPEQIIDGTGTGHKQKVDSNNRAHTFSVSQTIAEAAAREGDSYNINTGTINLTTANKSCVLYLKNNGNIYLAILTIGFLLGNSSGGTGDLTLSVTKNPTTGTIISGASPVLTNENKNAGSSQTLDVDTYKGAEGTNTTNGVDDWFYTLLAGGARPYVINTGSLVIPKGSSISISVTPQASNTSMDCSIFLSIIKDNS